MSTEKIETASNIEKRPNNNTKPNTKRIQIDMSTKTFEKLEKIKELNDFSTYTEMFKEMIRLYHYALTEEIEGAKFYVKRGNDVSELVMFAWKE